MSADLIVQSTKRINVVNVGGKNFTMNSTAKSRGELEAEISKMNMNVSFHQKKLIIGETKNSLDVAGSLLPASNFTLFILPMKSKGGGVTRNMVKDLMKEYPVEAREHFSKDKSYTVKKDVELDELLASWIAPDTAQVPASKEKEKKSKGGKKEKEAPLVKAAFDHAKEKYEGGIENTANFKKFEANVDSETIKMINEKLDRIIMFLEQQVAFMQASPVLPVPVPSNNEGFDQAFHELDESEISKVQRQIEKEFPDVKSY